MIESFLEMVLSGDIKLIILENKILGTMGPLKLIEDLPENF